MKTSEVLAGLKALGATVGDTGEPKEILLRWAADGLLTPPEGVQTGEEEWPAGTIAEAAALDVMIFRHGFQKDTLRILRGLLMDELREAQYDMSIVVSRIAEEDFYNYLPCVLFLIAYGKAQLGIPIHEIAALETWTEAGKVYFRRVGPELPDNRVHPRIFERITGRRASAGD